jgi:hypothetical protein
LIAATAALTSRLVCSRRPGYRGGKNFKRVLVKAAWDR